MKHSYLEQTMALGGILAALAQVQQLARFGESNTEQLKASFDGIILTNPENTAQVYPDRETLHLGLKRIEDIFGNQARKDTELTRYLFGILTLERKLNRSSKHLSLLSERIQQVHRQLDHFAITDEQVVANFSSIYMDVISDLGPKIQITGNPTHLQRPIIQQKVRALLLAAMRSAVLWRQLGGKRRHFILARQQILEAVKKNLTL